MKMSEAKDKQDNNNNINNLETFDGEDLDTWMKRLETHLKGKDLWYPVHFGSSAGKDVFIKKEMNKIDDTKIKDQVDATVIAQIPLNAITTLSAEELSQYTTTEQVQQRLQYLNNELEKVVLAQRNAEGTKLYEKRVRPYKMRYAEMWENKCFKAMDIIQSKVKDRFKEKIIGEDDPRKAIEKIQKYHAEIMPERVSMLMTRLNDTKLKDKKDMSEYLNIMLKAARLLRSNNQPVSELMVIQYIFKGLTKPYKQYADMLSTRRDLTIDMVTAKLQAQELEMLNEGILKKPKENVKRESNEQVFTLMEQVMYSLTKKNNQQNKGNKSQQKQSRRKDDDECHYCHKRGHYARDCRKKKADRQQQEHSKAAQVEENDSNGVEILMIQQVSKESDVDESVNLVINPATQLNEKTYMSVCNERDGWIIDSGASRHICNNKSWFIEEEKCKPIKVEMADGKVHMVTETGKIKIINEEGKTVELNDVLYLREAKYNIVSIKAIMERRKHLIVNFMQNGCQIIKGKKCILNAKLSNGLYQVKLRKTKENINIVDVTNMNESELWHCRFGHASYKDVKHVIENDLVTGIKNQGKMVIQRPDDHVCKGCVIGKSTRKVYARKKDHERPKGLGDLTHMDLSGKAHIPTFDDKNYYAVYLDDSRNLGTVYLLERKDQTYESLVNYKARIESSKGKLRVLRCDNGSEYINHDIQRLCEKEGITIQSSAPYTPQQNGKAERYIRTITEMARCMLKQANLPRKFWGEAIKTAAYLRNRLPSSATDRKKTAYEELLDKKPDVSNLRVFGCKCYAHVTKKDRKWNDKAKECLFMGYATAQKAYRLYDIKEGKIIISNDVTFEEPLPDPVKDDTPINDDGDLIERELIKDEQQHQYLDANCFMAEIKEDYRVPGTYEQAIFAKDADKWIAAMKSEYKSLMKKKVWTIVEAPLNASIMKSGWVYAIKFNPDGSIERHKARFVAKGYSQIWGIDFIEVFAPVISHIVVRVLLAWAGTNGYEIDHMDVETAFLNGDMDVIVYIRQPKGFEDGNPNHVCRLNKSLYGTKQGARQWYKHLNETMKQLNFKRCDDEHCLFYRDDDHGGRIFVMVYVDDIVIIAQNKEIMQEVKGQFKSKYTMKDLGKLSYFIGMEIKYDQENKKIMIHQQGYISKMLKEFQMYECKGTLLPMDNSNELVIIAEGEKEADGKLYRKIIGGLLYLAIATRPDLAFYVSLLARFCKEPKIKHLQAAKRILQYVKKTEDYGLRYMEAEPMCAYVDASWAGDRSDRHSTTGYVILFGGAPIAWRSVKQKSVALSTVEAEYVALATVLRQLIWLMRLMKTIGILHEEVKVYEDNRGCIKLSKNPVLKERTKHIDISFHFVREMVEDKKVIVEYCPTNEMLADVFTKSSSGIRLRKTCAKLKLCRLKIDCDDREREC